MLEQQMVVRWAKLVTWMVKNRMLWIRWEMKVSQNLLKRVTVS